MFELLKTLADAYGATGRETKVANVIEGLVREHVDSVRRDNLGNLICVKNGTDPNGKRIMLSAHMDHIGFIVAAVEKEGFLRVAPVGGIGLNVSQTRHVSFENGVQGVLVRQPLKEGETAAMKHFYIDIGAKDRADAEARVRIGDVAVYAPDFFELGSDMLAGPAMDNRAGCCVLIETLKALKQRTNEIIAVFTVQEEVGCRGAMAAAYAMNPDLGVALDVTLCGDTPGGPKIAVKAGEGPCVKIMDSSLVCSPKVVHLMEDAAQRAGVKAQREVLTAGGTDASRIQLTRGGVHAGVLSIACRYVHSACEAVSLSDMEGGVKLLTALSEGNVD